jgi:hypothetical protein
MWWGQFAPSSSWRELASARFVQSRCIIIYQRVREKLHLIYDPCEVIVDQADGVALVKVDVRRTAGRVCEPPVFVELADLSPLRPHNMGVPPRGKVVIDDTSEALSIVQIAVCCLAGSRVPVHTVARQLVPGVTRVRGGAVAAPSGCASLYQPGHGFAVADWQPTDRGRWRTPAIGAVAVAPASNTAFWPGAVAEANVTSVEIDPE